MASSQSILQIIIEAVDESAAALEGTQNNLKAVGEEAISAGTQLAVAGAAITAAYVGVVDAAANVQESQDNLKQAVTDAMDSASASSSSYATQVQFLQDKINGYKASIAEATATLDTHTGSTIKVAAAHDKAAASIATDQANIQKYQQQLDLLKNAQDLQGQSTDEVTAKLENQATANVALGFSVSDSTRSLSQAFTATKSVSEALQVNEAAMDLARAKNIDLATATNQVILAMNGQGRALATYGIQIKDGLSGMDALQAVQGAVNGQAQAYADTLSGQLAVAMASFNKLLSDMGTTQLPLLTQLLQVVVKIIDAVDQFAQSHQKLTEVILLSVGAFGAVIAAIGTFLVGIGTLLIVIGTLTLPLTALIAVVALLAATIVTNWQSIGANIEVIWQSMQANFTAMWTNIKNAAKDALDWLSNFINGSIEGVQTVWNTVWGGIASFFEGIWNGMKTSVQSAISFIQNAVQSFVSWAENILAPILGPLNAIGSAAKGVGGLASSALSVIGVHDAIITPGGQIIQSDPSDYLIATKTPGSLGGGGGGVVVNIYGDNYGVDPTMIANALAKQINRQLKLRNYAL